MVYSPMPHQQECVEKTALSPSWALFWEPGTGKTKATLDTFFKQVRENLVDALIVVAPNFVHQNWTGQEIPKHTPPELLNQFELYTWFSGTSRTKKEEQRQAKFLRTEKIPILSVTYDALMTDRCKDFVLKLLKERDVLMVLDEAHRIKSPGAKRTKRLLALGKYAKTRRILTGTPLANSPFDGYSLFRFLEADFWKTRELGTFSLFKSYFGVWEDRKLKKLSKRGKEIEYEVCVSYRNLEQLQGYYASLSSRVLKEDVLKDLPPKVYTKFCFSMSREQERVYRELEEEFIVFLEDETVTADQAMTRLLRLQQVTCGYVPVDGPEPKMWLAKNNMRMEALKELCEDHPEPTIIFCRFVADIDYICDYLGDRCVRMDGSVPQKDRPEAQRKFQSGEVQFFVANPTVASEGIDLFAAKTVIYYSNNFKLTDRLQSEDRAHRKGQTSSVQYIDLIAEDTVDLKIIQALREKFDIAGYILKDRERARL